MNNSVRVAIQGDIGSFHHMAITGYFDDSVVPVPMSTFHSLFQEMKKNDDIPYATIAIENSIAGSILPNYQLLRKSNLYVQGEIYMQIRQNLLGLPGTTLEQLEEVHSHPMAILQCEEFFEKYPEIRLIEAEDTALSARYVRESNKKSIGAIASSLAAELYELDIIAESIETVKNNFTRFLILGRQKEESQDANKASLYFQLPNNPGALFSALEEVNRFGVNISKIQSIPEVAREWRYYFILDLEFEDRDMFNKLISRLEKVTQNLKVFGVYRKGVTVNS